MLVHIYDSSRLNVQLPLYVIRLAIEDNPGNYGSSAGIPYYRWIYCVNGSGQLKVNNETVFLQEGYGYLVYPESSYRFHSLSEDWQLDMLDFNGPIAASLLKLLNMHESQAFHFLDTDFFHKKILEMARIYESKENKESTDLSTACYDFLIQIGKYAIHHKREAIDSNVMDYNDPVVRIISFLESHYSEPITLEQIAEHVGLTKQYICAIFKKTINRTIITELNYIRIAHARIILRQYPEKRLEEVAKMCGYDNAVYFGKVFKKVNGNTPDQYRKML